MKRTNKQNQVKNATDQNIHLIEGAELIIREIKTPAALFEFMFESQWWTEELEEEMKLESTRFLAREVFKNILQPWFAGGPSVVENIAAALYKVRDSIGAQGYDHLVSVITQAFGLNIKQGIYYDSRKYLNIIATLLELSSFITSHEEALLKNIEDRLSKVA